MPFCVYLLTNTVNGKVYVGKASDLDSRWQKHLYNASEGHDTALYRAVRKYGGSAFTRRVLDACDTEDEAFAREIHWIATLAGFGPGGYNMTAGGEGPSGWKHAEESKALMVHHGASNGMHGQTHTPEAREKIAAAAKAQPRVLGRKHTDEAKVKIAAAAKGNKRCAGRECSDETREKMSASHRGHVPWNKGKAGAQVWTEEQKIAQAERVRLQWASGKRAGFPKSDEWRRNHSIKIRESWARKRAEKSAADADIGTQD